MSDVRDRKSEAASLSGPYGPWPDNPRPPAVFPSGGLLRRLGAMPPEALQGAGIGAALRTLPTASYKPEREAWEPAGKPLEYSVRHVFGLDPGMRRTILWPGPVRQADGRRQWVAPEVLYSLAKAVTLPGHVMRGGSYTEGDAIEMALNVTGGGVANRTRGVARGALTKPVASRNPTIYNPPAKPPRPFAADYPRGARNVGGRLTLDIEGRPLTAERVVGRRMVGGDDVALPEAELNPLAEALTGRGPARVPARLLRGDAGRYSERIDPATGDRVRFIELSHALTPGQAVRVLGHETGHAIDELAGQIPATGVMRELRRVYNTLNTGQERIRNLTGPGTLGYRAAEVPRELWAEAIRAYLTNPNYFKTVAPKSAAAIRGAVNANPRLSPHIQFNVNGSPLPAFIPLADQRNEGGR